MKHIFLFFALVALSISPLLAQEQDTSLKKSVAPAPFSPAFGEKLHIAGIHNAGKVNEVLYRGAQPHAESFQQLKVLGITTIVDLRGEGRDQIEWERKETEA